ncbi:MAG: DciA family protein [Pseudomonadota bacterium]
MKQLNNFISPDILQRLDQNTRLARIVSNALPAELDGRVYCIGMHKKTLNLCTDSPATSTRLRFFMQTIIDTCKELGELNVENIRITTDSDLASARQIPARKTSKPVPSENVGAMFEATAESVDDPRLKSALERLAKVSKS